MTIKYLPDNQTAIDMMDMVAPIYDDSYIAKNIYNTLGKELGDSKKIFDDLRRLIFIETADKAFELPESEETANEEGKKPVEWGLKYHEQKYGIEVNETSDCNERIRNIKTKRIYNAPVNPKKLCSYLQRITGCRATYHEYQYAYIILNVWYEDKEPSFDKNILYHYVYQMRPAHVVFDLNYVKEGYWYLDGSFQLDGSRFLDAGENDNKREGIA